MNKTRDRLLGLWILLVALGLSLTIGGLLPGEFFLLLLGLGFLGTYGVLGGRCSYENVGFLIPGLILLAIGGFAFIEEFVTSGEGAPSLFFLFMAIAFLGVALLHTRLFAGEDHGTRWWPLYPAGGLALFSALLAAQGQGWLGRIPGEILNYLGVAALVVLGLWFLFRRPSDAASR